MPYVVTSTTSAVRLRALAVWAAVTVGTVGVGLLTLPVITAGPSRSFVEVLTRGCGVVGLIAACAAWWVTSDVVRGVLAGTAARARPVGPVRAAILLACGLTLLGGPASAHVTATLPPAEPDAPTSRSDPHRPLSGLVLPDRPTGAAGARDASPSAVAASLTVRPGDHLWGIARARLGPTATNARIAAYVRVLHQHNLDVIGEDPDLILPGQRLRLPPAPGRDPR